MNMPPTCRGCGKELDPDNYLSVDGCPCSSYPGINHGLVPTHVCICFECDPDRTASVRTPAAGPTPVYSPLLPRGGYF